MSKKTTHQVPFQQFHDQLKLALAQLLRVKPWRALALIAAFERTTSIKYGEKYIRRFGKAWVHATKNRKLKKLHPVHTVMHLLGAGIFGVFRLRRTRVLVLDIDGKTPRTRATIEERYWAARRALGMAPCVLLRSSTSPTAGLHVYFFLRRRHRSERVNWLASSALRRAGLVLGAGRLEVFPNGGNGVRLPLAPDSMMLDPETLKPVAFKGRGKKRVLDLAKALPLFLSEARRCAVELKTLVGGDQ